MEHTERRCQRCGAYSDTLMAASLGIVCPDCYDAASDGDDPVTWWVDRQRANERYISVREGSAILTIKIRYEDTDIRYRIKQHGARFDSTTKAWTITCQTHAGAVSLGVQFADIYKKLEARGAVAPALYAKREQAERDAAAEAAAEEAGRQARADERHQGANNWDAIVLTSERSVFNRTSRDADLRTAAGYHFNTGLPADASDEQITDALRKIVTVGDDERGPERLWIHDDRIRFRVEHKNRSHNWVESKDASSEWIVTRPDAR